MNIKIRTSFFDIQKFYLAVDEKALVMRNADNQIIIPIKELTAVQLRTMTDGSVSVAFSTPEQTISGSLEDTVTSDALVKALRFYEVDCHYLVD